MREARNSRDERSRAHGVELPAGVDLAEWSLERVRVQNPSIRSYLGCIRQLEEVLDSNYAILHCSPERLSRLWHRVRDVSHLIRSELVPTLEQPSVIPALGEARLHALASFRDLAETVLAPMEEYGPSLRPDQHSQVRKLLCVSLGKIYAFLRDTFGEIVANDPRSRYDADYFLSRRFAQDIDESEWLYSSVYELTDLVRGLEKTCALVLGDLQSRMREQQRIPNQEEWEEASRLLETLLGDLVAKLKSVLGLKSIRVDDMEALESHKVRLSSHCRSLRDVHSIGSEVIRQLEGTGGPTLAERGQKTRDLTTCHRVISARMVEGMTKVADALRALAADTARAREGIERRRALMLAKDLGEFRSGRDGSG
jgi:hypothetical protein